MTFLRVLEAVTFYIHWSPRDIQGSLIAGWEMGASFSLFLPGDTEKGRGTTQGYQDQEKAIKVWSGEKGEVELECGKSGHGVKG